MLRLAGFVLPQSHSARLLRWIHRTCAKALVIASRKIRKDLPLNRAVEIRLAAEKPGTLRFAYPMDMIAGEIVVD